MQSKLTEADILGRLFAPSTYLPELKGKKSLVVAGHGAEHSATHAELEEMMLKAYSHLEGENIGVGDNVIFCCENRLEFSPMLLACWAIGATTTLIDYRTELTELYAVCKKLDAKLLFTSMTASEIAFSSEFAQTSSIRLMHAPDLSKDKPTKTQIDWRSVDLDRPLLALFTSGTTGKPKTAVHNLRTLVQNIIDLAQAVDLPSDLTGLTPLPVSHVFGLTVLLVTQVLGMKTVLTVLDPVTFIKAVHFHKPQLMAALPQFYGALLAAPKGVIDLKDAKLLLSGGAPMTVSLVQKFQEVFGKLLNNGYGSTESKIFALNKDGPVLSVGRAVGQVKIEVVDKSGTPVADGQFGEVIVTSPTLMGGYLNDPQKTAEVLKGDKYKTGDYGYLEDGYLFVVGRISDTVTVGGVVIEAGEIEAALRNYTEVKEAAITPVNNKWLGQVIKASVVLIDEDAAKGLTSTDPAERKATKQALTQKFRKYCAEHLPRRKRPMLWHFIGPHDDLPKTLAGKVDKKALRDQS